ncbi:putative drug exporter of the RND superfamily [Plantibacter flavus]|uniref:RND superfamily putative drug exporter n=1 Tax=Plantibacter flavus TaxID=150123 RepID=A0A3N2BZG1_9MICO|nr:MMPL family transporter [Plantibacter flavus]ROR80648.1 RND superfamily putative drug exporter [Plantibacter flavus]SMG32520.1 putative drug exporter of the RND superfamily [Plantibacter flavus]
MSSLLYTLGRWAFGARKLVLILWIAVLALAGGGALLFNQGTDNAFSIPGTESQEALDSLDHTFPQVAGASAQIIVVAPKGDTVEDAGVRSAIDDAVTALGDIGQVEQAVSPFDENVTGAVSEDQRAALISIQFDGAQTDITAATISDVEDAEASLANALPAGAESSLGGQLISNSLPTLSVIELVGVVVALVVLILTFGSFLAAGMPLITALLGVGISMALIFVATVFGPISSTTPMLALMLGLAVGIDYALFIISRHQDGLRSGLDPAESAARATATAGSAVIFAGLTVIIALLGLAVANIPFLTTMGVAAAVGVAIAVVISLTLIPAMLGFAGERLRPKARRARKRAAARGAAAAPELVEGQQDSLAEHHTAVPEPVEGPNRFFLGWVRGVTRIPIVTIVAVVAVLGALAIPALSLRLALPDAGSLPEGDGARTTYDLVSEHFGEGFNGPLIVTGGIVGSTDPLGLMADLKQEIEGLDGVAAVPLATPNATADTGIIQVIPSGSPDSQATKDLVAEIRGLHQYFQDEYDVDLQVTGFTAIGIDISDRLGGALLPFGLIVVGLSLVLLTMVFRSIWVPIKATLGYLLSVAASFGVVALVFEHGVFAEALHVARTGPVISFMPIILMGVLFGLAMDYEVFLVSRMREDFVHSGLARRSVETGFLGSAKVVTAAAVIMFAVFAAFVPEGDTNIKPIALGLAVGVFVDAFIVRMTLVPAVLALLGDHAWYLPKWLDRILPSFDVEGEGLQRELELREWRNGDEVAIAAAGVTLAGADGPLYEDVDTTVAVGGVLAVQGARPVSVTALLLTLAGRLEPDHGRLKVAGLVLPVRAGAVRSRVAYVRLDHGEPVGTLASALAERPAVIVLDGVDTVPDDDTRRGLYERLLTATRAAERTRRPLTIVVGTADASSLADVLPTTAPEVLDLDRAASTTPSTPTAIAESKVDA